MPGLSSAAVMSRTSLASRQTLRIACWPSASRRSIFDLLRRFSRTGTPVSAQSGRLIDLGRVRMGESGYMGRTRPV